MDGLNVRTMFLYRSIYCRYVHDRNINGQKCLSMEREEQRMNLFVTSSFLLSLITLQTSAVDGFSDSSKSNFQPKQVPNNEVNQEGTMANNEEVKKLPEADPNDTSMPTLKFGDTMRFEELGPIIINSDGTTRRIDNWDTLTDHEKEVTWRRIRKRNEQRKKALLEKQQNDSEN